jgi:hypothetical protein
MTRFFEAAPKTVTTSKTALSMLFVDFRLENVNESYFMLVFGTLTVLGTRLLLVFSAVWQ